MISFNIQRLVYWLTPPHMQSDIDGNLKLRVTWLQYLLNPFATLINDYNSSRITTKQRCRIFGVASVEKLLQTNVDAAITITNTTGIGLPVPAIADNIDGVPIPSIADSLPGVQCPSLLDIGFIGDTINVPDNTTNNTVETIIANYTYFGTKYQIKNP